MGPLETPRLLLRPFETRDVQDFIRLATEDDIAVIPPDCPPGTARVLTESWMDYTRSASMRGSAYQWAVTLRASGGLIGSAGLGDVDHKLLIGHINYWIGAAFRNHGYGTEAARAVLNFSFDALQLQRMAASTEINNVASVRILEKLGFRPTVGLKRHMSRHPSDTPVQQWEIHVSAWET